MRSTPGHMLTVPGEVKIRGWRARAPSGNGSWVKNFTAVLAVQGESMADIESQLKPTELAGTVGIHGRTVTFVDGTRWSIVSQPPDEPPEAKKRFGVTYETRHPVNDRIARVIAERDGDTLAEAHWPEPSVQKRAMVESIAAHGPNLVERLGNAIAVQTTEAAQINVADTTMWLLPVKIPGRFNYGMRLGDVLTVLSRWGTTKLIPNEPVPLEAALLCWHIESVSVGGPRDVGRRN